MPYSSRQVIRALERLGFAFVGQEGSHMKFRKRTSERTLTVIVKANAHEIPGGTFNSILKQAGISREEFEEALKR